MPVLDGIARRWAEDQIRRTAESYYPGSRALARIRSEYFLRPLVRRGTVSDIEVALFDAEVSAEKAVVRLRRIILDLYEVTIRRRDLAKGRMRLKDLGSGRVDVEIDGPSLASAVGLPLVFHEDEVEIRRGVGPLAVSARGALSVDENVLRFRPGTVQGVPLLVSMDFEFPLPVSPVWPRAAEVRSIEGGLALSCDLEDVPPGLIDPRRS
ncbi:MAG TPA: hypothetical protein VI854_08580 [Acidimicrobiia bacterium]|nr:hypothetical protein [Acidimicrobiia bacterium]